mgnify:FL=1
MFKTPPTTTTTEGEAPAAEPTAAARVPMYRLRKHLDEMELALRYPRLNKKWRQRMPTLADPRNQPGADGKVHSAPRGKAKPSAE